VSSAASANKTGPLSQGLPRRLARWLWRRIPTPIRYRIYQRLIHSNHFLIRGFWRSVKGWRYLSLWNQRANAREMWPEARRLDHLALTLWGAFLRFHTPVLRLVWAQAHRLRRGRAPRAVHNQTVLHVTGSFDLGGTQTQIRNLCEFPGARYRHEATEIFPELNYLYRRGVAVERDHYVRGGLLGRAAGRLVMRMNYRSSQLVQIYKVLQDIRRVNPSIVVGWGHEMCVTAFIAASIARVPHIVFCIRTVNPTYLWVPKFLGDMLHTAHRRMSPLTTRVVVNSTMLQADHAAWSGVPRERIAVCANGVAAAAISAADKAAANRRVRVRLGIDTRATVITNVGRFSGEKGQHSIVEANRLLLRRGIDRPFVWLLCGDGPTLDDVRALAERYGTTNIRFLGRTAEVGEILCATDIFVMPSDFEGMPNAMMEAMALGIPCVSAKRSGATDVARDGQEACYYPPRDALGLAQHLKWLIEHADEAKAMGTAGQVRVGEFSVERSLMTFEQVLDESMRLTRSA
jgi:glycosyltransferase involved in cell wall biosynthesis